MHQLDVADPALFPPDAQRKFFMDIKLAPYAPGGADNACVPVEMDADGEVLAGDVQWMRDKWRELMGKMYGADRTPKDSPDKDKRMDDVVAQMKDFIKEGSPLRRCAPSPNTGFVHEALMAFNKSTLSNSLEGTIVGRWQWLHIAV